METKLCRKCGVTKGIDCFSKLSRARSGKHPNCKDCVRSFKNEWYTKHPDYHKKYRIANLDKCTESLKKYENSPKGQAVRKANYKKWYAINREKINNRRTENIKDFKPGYINYLLRYRGINPSMVPDELKNQYKEIVQLKRELKNEQVRNKI